MKRCRSSGLIIWASFALCGVGAAVAQSGVSRDLHLAPGRLSDVLRSFADQTNLQVVFYVEDTREIHVGALEGRFTPEGALNVLLQGSGLEYEYVDGQTISVKRKEARKTAQGRMENGTKSELQLVQASKSAASGQGVEDKRNQPAEGLAGTTKIDEIVVTAQKRVERLQDVPVPVTAIGADALLDTNQFRLQDYFARVPGLNFQAGSRSEPLISIRGINSLQNPTVGVTVDDVPYGSILFRGGGNISPDIDPSDVERIEVLRGPQGTLYGVSSLGGVIKYVTAEPSTDGLSGTVQTGVNSVHDGHELGYNVRAAINVPLSSTLAVRASAFTRVNPGYIDNLQANIEDANRSDAAGGRLAMLLKPSEAFSLRLSALFQERNNDGTDLTQPSLGDLQQNYLPGTGWTQRRLQAYSATVSARLGAVDLVSLSGYNINGYDDAIDLSFAYGPIATTNFGVAGVPYIEGWKARKLSQELRLSGPIGERFEWLLGGFYTRERNTSELDVLAASSSTGVVSGMLSRDDARSSYEEYAAFADLTIRITGRLDVQVGGRQSHNRQDYSLVSTGVPQLIQGGALVIPDSVITETPFTYLVTPRLRISPNLMTYARFASGYRAGGINITAARGFPVPPGYDSDKTYNYEIGVKGSVLHDALSFDASVYYIDWKDLQLGFSYAPGVNYQANGSRAKSQGAELSIEGRPLAGLTLTAAMAYDDAVLTESFGSSTTRGMPGDRLPFSSRFAGNLSIEQKIPLTREWIGFVGGAVSYVGDRVGLFRPNVVRQSYPAYTQVDVSAGVEFGDWRAIAFATNLTDKRGVIGGGIGQTNPNLFSYIQPRTVGLSLSKTFGR